MSKPTPAPLGDGPFFTVHVHALDLHPTSAHVPPGGPQITIQAHPAGLLRLLAEVKKPTVAALLMFLHHGHVTVIDHTVRVEVENWGRDWLIHHGFTAHQGQSAIAELRAQGWIRTEQLRRPGGWLGPQIGVLAGSVYGSGDVYLAPERKNPTARTPTGEGKPLSDTSEPGDNSPAAALDGKTVKDISPHPETVPLSTGEGKPIKDPAASQTGFPPPLDASPLSGQTFPPTVSVSSLQYLQSLLRTTPMDAHHLYAAITGLHPTISDNPQRAARLLTGLLMNHKADYRTPIADLLGFPHSRDHARDIAHYLTATILDPTNSASEIPYLAAAGDIHLKNPHDEFLPARWFLALASASCTNVKNAPAFIHAAMYRREWKLSPSLRSLLETLVAIATPTPTITAPQNLDPHLAAHEDQVLAVLADFFDVPDSQIDIWRSNPRLRGHAIARYTTANGGLTPDDVLRTATQSSLQPPTRTEPQLSPTNETPH